jgi:hypothetical protein
MSLQHAAKHLEKHGRNGDTMLVHMSKGEVKSLNDLAMANGGQLTINPHTGLPEAGFLRKILPMVAGAALTGISMGAINPITAGLIIGGGTAVATGDIKEGLSAGLGAYGGAGMYSGAVTAGATTPVNPAATPVASEPPVSLAPNTVRTPTPTPPPVSTERSIRFDIPGATDSMGQPIPHAARASEFIPGNTPKNLYSSDITRSAQYDMAKQGIADVAQPGGGTKLYEALDKTPYTLGAKTTLAAAATPAAYEMYQEQQEKNKPEPGDSDPGQQYTYEANATIPTPDADPFGREKKYFNQQYTKLASGGISDAYNLGGYSDGGRLLRGPGDGVSDSIPAVIGKKQPARLADGEFVVPARIVSELGNGSTEAGARKLYAMMDRIQKARGKTVGKNKVAKNSRAEKYLPA